ncbi:MAG: elongation factor P [Candidatus Kerfeldbacteria bacterium]|nr:elongation factor P [Candidatus Kerfeldbacteria bacterium]
MTTLSSLKDIRVGVAIDIDAQPYQVLWADFMRTAQRKPVMRTKLRNLITGQVLEKTFKPGDKVAEADLQRGQANFMYRDGDNFNFMDNATFEQFGFALDQIGDIGNYVKEGSDVDLLKFNGNPVAVLLPPKVELQVIEAPPGVKGDSAANVTKQVKVETGHLVNVPLFIREGDTVRINTSTGDYVERVNK